ncbi:hypothetical protein N9W00_01030 [Arcobacteraceae bacterium]|nr:hypothetical protein [Arcobacteraceae bacterium]
MIICFALSIKVLLLVYFIYTIDLLASIIPGAMCAAGVISSNQYGETLLVLKIMILFLSASWIVINKLDLEYKNFPYLTKKFKIFIFIYSLLIIELILEFFYFTNISTESLATCCSVLYNSESVSAIPFNLSIQQLIILFYSLFIISFILNNKKLLYFSAFVHLFFLYISYYCVIYFFGTYIYELPTHNCPFCMLQSDYNYVGYIVFISLFLGVFFGILNTVLKVVLQEEIKKYYLYSNIFYTLFIFISSFYVVSYYMKNGVFL